MIKEENTIIEIKLRGSVFFLKKNGFGVEKYLE